MRYEELCLNIGLKIKFFRQQRHMTQAIFAEKLNMDVRYLSDIERGKKNMTLKTIFLYFKHKSNRVIRLYKSKSRD